MIKDTIPFPKSRKLKKEDGTIAYSWDGKLHNWDGPALIDPDGNKIYALYGIEMSKDKWKETKSQREGLPYYKNPSIRAQLDNYRN